MGTQDLCVHHSPAQRCSLFTLSVLLGQSELLSSTAEPQFLSGFLSGTGYPESSQAFCLCMLACIRIIPSQKGKHLLFSSSKSRWEVHLFNGPCPQLIQFGKWLGEMLTWHFGKWTPRKGPGKQYMQDCEQRSISRLHMWARMSCVYRVQHAVTCIC